MKRVFREIVFSAFMGIMVPWFVVSLAVLFMESDTGAKEERDISFSVPEEEIRWDQTAVQVRLDSGLIARMGMDDYLAGVVLAEMPAYFEPDALKAQAVAARTFTAKAMQTLGKHHDGTVCTEPGCCQAYIAEEKYIQSGGTESAVEKIRKAVSETSGEVITYEGELIEAVYFSCSGGNTEDAAEVWGTEVPYLVATQSPGEEEAASFQSERTFTRNQLESLLQVTLSAEPESWFSDFHYTAGGGVASVTIGGKSFSGTRVRKLLGLRSTMFAVLGADGKITITTLGYGHRVGMSQYGADAMASDGKNYRQILAYYYAGTTLVQLEDVLKGK